MSVYSKKLFNKKILILSPQSWGNMLLAKHHYAIELAKSGNRVFFLDPPFQGKGWKGSRVQREMVTTYPNLVIIRHRLFFPYILNFHAPVLFRWLMQFQVKHILKSTGNIDIVWSFDLGNLYPLQFFPERVLKIFHPVDEPGNTIAIEAATSAAIIFSATDEILSKYRDFPVPKYFVNHGISETFVTEALQEKKNHHFIRVGISGNLLRPDIDRDTLTKVFSENPEIIFECWGAYEINQSNIGGADDTATILFIQNLQVQPNVILHGIVSTKQLASEYQRMDAFLICYNVQKDQSKGTNYHKVMEFLSTGKVIISNNISTYEKKFPGLIQMVKERDSNQQLPVLFKEVIQNLNKYNSPELVQQRIAFARINTYSQHIEYIDNCIQALNRS